MHFGKFILKGIGICFLLFSASTYAVESDLEGTWWRLTKRVLPDGTVQTPPTVNGYSNTKGGINHLLIQWTTPEGRPAFITQIGKFEWSETEVSATSILMIMDDGRGKPPLIKHGGERWTSPVKREGARITYKQPLGAPTIEREGNLSKATVEGRFVDYWEKVE